MKSITLLLILFLAFPDQVRSQSYQNHLRKSPSAVPVLTEIAKYPNARDFTLSPSGDEAYFTILSPQEEISAIVRIRKQSNKWSEPELAGFSGKYRDLEPFLSPDGLTLYFASNRPLDHTGTDPKDFDLWYVERQDLNGEWSEPVNPGKPVNTEHNEFYPAVSASKNLYFTSDAPGFKGKDDILFCAWNDGRYHDPFSLSDSINSEGYEFNAFIAPDESFLIFSGYNRKDGFGSGDLYISYKRGDGWSAAKNLGAAVNSKSMDYCPYVDTDEKILYFTSKRSAVQQKAFTSIEEFLNEINKYSNGFSRIYKISVNELQTK